jgi:hypothetical protein
MTETALCCNEIALMIRAKEEGYVNETTFVADTGATSHMVNSKKYVTDITQITSEITTGNKEQRQCTEKRTYGGYFKNKHGHDVPIILTDVLHVPWLSVNQLSITKCITNCVVQITENNRNLFLSIFSTQIKFDKEIQHGTGKLFAIESKAHSCEAAYLIMDFDKFHIILVFSIFLDQTYAEFHKLDKSQIAKQVATITDELNEIVDEDEDIIKEVIEDDYLPN